MQSYSFYFNHKDIFFNIFLSFVKFFAAFRDNVSLFSRHSYNIYKGRAPHPVADAPFVFFIPQKWNYL